VYNLKEKIKELHKRTNEEKSLSIGNKSKFLNESFLGMSKSNRSEENCEQEHLRKLHQNQVF
jgi:hypothetical protein